MAHVKVVRRSMRPEEWTDLRFVWLQRGIYEEKFEITDLEIRDARQISENQYEYYSDEYRPLKKDDMYFTPDGTAFIRGHVPGVFSVGAVPQAAELTNEKYTRIIKTLDNAQAN